MSGVRGRAARILGRARTKNGILEYAQRLGSSPGKRDGLYWPTREGEPPVRSAPSSSRRGPRDIAASKDGGRTPYHGYFYRILTGQGPQAPGGAYDYVVARPHDRRLRAGGLPGRYGVSGVMTFLVNHDGVVYQKDLGANTTRLAESMKRFNPDRTWQKVDAVALKP